MTTKDPMMRTWEAWQSSTHGRLAMEIIALMVHELGGKVEIRHRDLGRHHLEFHHDARDDQIKLYAIEP